MAGSFSQAELPHKPGSLMATRLTPLASNPVEDNYSANVVGTNNATGRPIVAEPSSTQTVEANGDSSDYRVGETVDVARDRSTTRGGSRRAGVKRYSATLTADSPDSKPSTNAATSTPNTTGCSTSYTIKFSKKEAPPPEPPPETPPPSPDNPQPGDEQESKPENPDQPRGCDPQGSSQWYNSPDGEPTSCPAGTNYLGFADLGGGTFMVLCEGADRPTGDGCPYDPPLGNGSIPQGYTCVSGECVLRPGGEHATLAECQSAGCPTQGYGFVGGQCQLVPIADSQYPSLAACEADNPPEPPVPLPTGVPFRLQFSASGPGFTIDPGYSFQYFGDTPTSVNPQAVRKTVGGIEGFYFTVTSASGTTDVSIRGLFVTDAQNAAFLSSYSFAGYAYF